MSGPIFAVCTTEYLSRPGEPNHEVYVGSFLESIDEFRRKKWGETTEDKADSIFRPIQPLNYPWHEILNACINENNRADWNEGLNDYFGGSKRAGLLYVSCEPFPLEPALRIVDKKPQ